MALDAKTKLARAEVWITVASQANTDVIKARIYDPILSFYKNDKDYLKAVQEYNKIVAYIDSYKMTITLDEAENTRDMRISVQIALFLMGH